LAAKPVVAGTGSPYDRLNSARVISGIHLDILKDSGRWYIPRGVASVPRLEALQPTIIVHEGGRLEVRADLRVR
jgi:hypothetical protein